MVTRVLLRGRRVVVGLLVALIAAACAPSVSIPVTGAPDFVVNEYPLVEQSKDNPTHPEFQNWVPDSVILHRSTAYGGTIASVAVPDGGFGILPGRLPEGENLLQGTINGKAFALFLAGGVTHMRYNGQVLPNVYDEVVVGKKGELSIFNPGQNGSIVWFYALRDGLWYYVEAGAS